MDLDRIDFGIIGHLQRDARMSNKELAEAVGLAPSSCLERVRRLTREGILRGFHAEVDESALGIGVQAMVAVQLHHHVHDAASRFMDHALHEVDEVIGLFHVSGDQDFFLHVAVRDADHLRDLLLDRLNPRPEVARLQAHILFRHHRRPARPVPEEGPDEENRDLRRRNLERSRR